MSENTRNSPNYRFYDYTGGGVIEDIYAASLEEAIRRGREWIEGGDWSGDRPESADDPEVIARLREIELECRVGPIIYSPDPSRLDMFETVGLYGWEFREGVFRSDIDVSDYDAGEHHQIRSEVEAGRLGRLEVSESQDESGYRSMTITPSADWPVEIDEVATEEADTYDCSGSYDDPEPECPASPGWDFVSTVEAGLDEFGCRSHGGTAMTHYEVCRNTGVYRETYDPGFQRNPGEPLRTITYRRADDRSRRFVTSCHVEEDGTVPEWLTDYLQECGFCRETE